MKELFFLIAMVVFGTTLKAKTEKETIGLTKEMVELLDQKPEELLYKDAYSILTGESTNCIFDNEYVLIDKVEKFTWRNLFRNPFTKECGSVWSHASLSANRQEWKITHEVEYYGNYVDWKQVRSTCTISILFGLVVFWLTRRSYKKRLKKATLNS